MKTIITILFCLYMPSLLISQKSSNVLVETRLGWRFANSEGRFGDEVYHEAKPFSNKLAAVRTNEYFGYINGAWQFVISPQFDYAGPFEGSFAIVGKDEKYWIINKNGKIVHEGIEQVYNFQGTKNYFVAETEGKKGLKNEEGNWVCKPMFSDIRYDKEGFYLLTQSERRQISRFSVFTMSGQTFEAKDTIIDAALIGKGLIAMIRISDAESQLFICDVRFTPVFTKPYAKERMKRIRALTKGLFYLPKKSDKISRSGMYGEYVFSTSGKHVKNFDGFLLENDWPETHLAKFRRKYVEIDHLGNLASSFLYDKVFRSSDKRKKIVFLDRKWYYQEKRGYKLVPLNERIQSVHPSSVCHKVFFAKLKDDIKGRWVLMNLEGDQVLKHRFDEVGRFWKRGYIRAIKDEQLFYISWKGKIIWKDKKYSTPKLLNINYQTRVDAYAEKAMPLKTLLTETFSLNNQLSLILEGETTYREKYQGNFLYLVNSTKRDTIQLNTQDKRLYLVLEAKTENGTWKPIQYIPYSWCGNSYYSVELFPKSYFRFEIPQYHGVFPTKVRAKLTKYKMNNREPVAIYSNEVDMSINPGQFWVEKPYFSTNIMYPY